MPNSRSIDIGLAVYLLLQRAQLLFVVGSVSAVASSSSVAAARFLDAHDGCMPDGCVVLFLQTAHGRADMTTLGSSARTRRTFIVENF